MSLSPEEVQKIAHLSRLEIAEKDVAPTATALSKILDLIEQMNEADIEGVEPMAHPLDATQRLRDDAVTEENERELFQCIAPQVQDGLYLVPKVIDGGS